MVAISAAATCSKHDPQLPRDLDRIREPIKLNSGKSVNTSPAIGRGKVPVCISPSFGDRWLTPKVDLLVYRRSLYLDHRYSRWCWFWDESRRCAGGLLWPVG